jgi:hypothetical protein
MAPKKSTNASINRIRLFAKIIFIPVASLQNSQKSVKTELSTPKQKPASFSNRLLLILPYIFVIELLTPTGTFFGRFEVARMTALGR